MEEDVEASRTPASPPLLTPSHPLPSLPFQPQSMTVTLHCLSHSFPGASPYRTPEHILQTNIPPHHQPPPRTPTPPTELPLNWAARLVDNISVWIGPVICGGNLLWGGLASSTRDVYHCRSPGDSSAGRGSSSEALSR